MGIRKTFYHKESGMTIDDIKKCTDIDLLFDLREILLSDILHVSNQIETNKETLEVLGESRNDIKSLIPKKVVYLSMIKAINYRLVNLIPLENDIEFTRAFFSAAKVVLSEDKIKEIYKLANILIEQDRINRQKDSTNPKT